MQLEKFQLSFLTVDKIFTYKNPPHYQDFLQKKKKKEAGETPAMMCPVTATEKLRVQPTKKTLKGWQKVKVKLNTQFNNKRAIAVFIRLKKKGREIEMICLPDQTTTVVLSQENHLGKICVKITHTYCRTYK